ncbi:MAG: sigma-70 family RNA polymerase sigma factor [Pseudomonadota bacterium]
MTGFAGDTVADRGVDVVQDTSAPASRDDALRMLAGKAARAGVRIAFDLLGNRDDAEDAVQESLARACRGFDKLRDPGALEGWFYRVLTNHCLGVLRLRWLFRSVRRLLGGEIAKRIVDGEHGPEIDVEMIDSTPLSDEKLARARDVKSVLNALGALPPMQRATVVLRHGYDLPIAEIGGMLGVGPGTVKTHLVRGLDRLRVLVREKK